MSWRRYWSLMAILLGWLLCGLASYDLVKERRTRNGRRWTEADRVLGLTLAASGPVGFTFVLVFVADDYVQAALEAAKKRPANW